ncbi:MAG: hypothetical protein J6L59_02820 [Clostridia bacterium]|nr:hypothetical protein [Clostridia bacterium]
MKKISLFFTLLMMCLALSSCSGITMLSDSDADTYAKIHKRYIQMPSYCADVKITVLGNKTQKTYQAKQYYLSPDKMMLDFSGGLKIIFAGDKAKVISGENSEEFHASDDVNYLFVNEFFELYYRSQDTAVSTQNHDDGGSTFLETELINQTSHRYKAVLKVNNKTLNPERLTVRDLGGNDVICADFSSFLYNAKIAEEIFTDNGG